MVNCLCIWNCVAILNILFEKNSNYVPPFYALKIFILNPSNLSV